MITDLSVKGNYIFYCHIQKKITDRGRFHTLHVGFNWQYKMNYEVSVAGVV